MSVLSPYFARKMQRRRPLAIDPARSIAIKRNVHEWEVGAEAGRFARAFAEVMAGPDASFGPITVKRLPGREGKPFVAGERFSGCINSLPGWLADAFFSDFAEIVEAQPLRVVYRYLSGCPMAGTSTFEVTPRGSVSCSLRIIFEYQELGGLGVTVLHRFGLRLHDQVTRAQVEKTAERLGAPILSSTLPLE